MTIEGVIENVVFRNEENGYTVAKLLGENKKFTVVGKFMQVAVGENVKLEGNFVTNSRYGEQFSFDAYEIIYPKTLAGIEKYLGSGLIRGVGPVTAKSIVKEFKHDTLTIIEYAPEKLEKIHGISKKKAQGIGESFKDTKKIQAAVIFLQNYNITVHMAIKIYEKYHEKTIEVVKQNPYKLIEDVDGIGFHTADTIAKNMGIDSKSKFRARAGILHQLEQNSEKTGNTYIYKQILLSEVAKLLELDRVENLDLLESVLDDLKLEKIIMDFFQEKKHVIMLSKYYFIEKAIAQKLCLLNAMAKENNHNVSKDINCFETINSIKLHEVQKKAIEMAVNSGVSIITGGPGTGKTTIIKCIINILNQMGQKVMLMAPTGRAAKRLNESTGYQTSTIHRALELDFRNRGAFLYNETNPLKTDAIIIDEVSMVDVMLANNLLKALPRDCHLILVGDKDQLPSVGAGNVLDDILKSEIFSVTHLTKIFRQEDSGLIIPNAHLINKGEMPVFDNSGKDFFFEQKIENHEIAKSIIELVTSRIPNFKKIDNSKIQILTSLKAGISGANSLNQELQQKLNPPSINKMELTIGTNILREGDKVMHIANNYNLNWKRQNGYLVEEGAGVFNGDMGYIHKIDRQNGETTVWFDDGRECVYPRTEVASLVLAYAITIHKSQGSEFEVVVIPVIAGPKMILTRNLIYTAVTRAKHMVVLVGDKKNLKRMIDNNYTLVRLTMLKNFLLEMNENVKEMFS